MSSALDNQKKLAQTFIKTEATWEGDDILSLRTEDCLYEIFPKNLGHPIRDSKATKEFYAQLKPLWSGYKNDVLQIVHDAEAHKCVLHIMNTAGTPAGPFEMESVFILTFTKDGSKICKVDEMLDSEYINAFFAKLPKAQGESI